jgi:hypothetical protein
MARWAKKVSWLELGCLRCLASCGILSCAVRRVCGVDVRVTGEQVFLVNSHVFPREETCQAIPGLYFQ